MVVRGPLANLTLTKGEEMEEWRDVVGYEGRYKISNKGRVLSTVRNVSGIIMKLKRHRDGYVHIGLRGKQKNPKWFKVHRLVAEAFIPNPQSKPQVHHKDSVRDNNHLDNLEWVTNSENMLYAHKKSTTPAGGHCTCNNDDNGAIQRAPTICV